MYFGMDSKVYFLWNSYLNIYCLFLVFLSLDNIVDVVFFLDILDGVNFFDFKKEKVFVKLLVKCLNVLLGKF